MFVQVMIEATLLFLIIWGFFRFIVPMFKSNKPVKPTNVYAKKEKLKNVQEDLSNVKEELDVTIKLSQASKEREKVIQKLNAVESTLEEGSTNVQEK